MFRWARTRPNPDTGVWPNGEPQSVRDCADQISSTRCYTVFMVVIGGYDEYQTVAVFADRDAAQRKARAINEASLMNSAIGPCVCIEHCARVEEIAFYPGNAEIPVYTDEVTALWNSIFGM